MKKLLQHLALAALAFSSVSVFAANEIKLQKAQSTYYARYGVSGQTTSFEAIVANLAYQKQVYAHVKNSSGAWIDVPLTYSRSISGNREIWKGHYQPATEHNVEYALKYVVNGQTYWDNNNGANYQIASRAGSILATGVNVYDRFYGSTQTIGASTTTFGGAVTLRNLAPAKQVRVHYTTNNWTTSNIANATFSSQYWDGQYIIGTPNPSLYGFEEWYYSLNIGSANQVQYAIEYVVNGQTYWDNNFGQNYSVTLVRQ